MFDGNNDAKRDDGRVAALSGSVRRRWSAAEKAAVVRETLVPGRVFLTWPGAGRWIRSRSTGGGTVKM
jgi:transposase-like protein